MAADVVTLIMNDHRVLEGLFEKLRSREGDPQALLNEVEVRLTAHSRAEEDHVYSAILSEEPSEAGEVYHGFQEHHEAAAMLYELKSLEPGGPEYTAKLEEFIDAVTHHVEEEESELLPTLEESIDAERLTELGAKFEEERLRELAAHGLRDQGSAASASASGSRAGERAMTGERGMAGEREMTGRGAWGRPDGAESAGGRSDRKASDGGRGGDVSEMTKAELYERAKAADIPGRSQMSKEELARALEKSRR
jgi:hemerythrin superfamily protein